MRAVNLRYLQVFITLKKTVAAPVQMEVIGILLVPVYFEKTSRSPYS